MKFTDTPKRTAITKPALLTIYERMFGADGNKLPKPALIANMAHLGRCECDCKRALRGKVDFDHRTPLALQIQEDDKPAPDIYWMALHKDCHAKKTKQDVKAIAKCKRLAGLSGQQSRRKTKPSQWQPGAKIPSRKMNQKYKPNIKRIDD